MRIHTSTNLMAEIEHAAKVAGAEVYDLISNDSRSHDYGFTVSLTGDAPNRPSKWQGDIDGDVRAASWDQWGVFFSVLFDRDPDMVVGNVGNPTYANVQDFDRKTGGRFARHLNIEGVRVDPATMVNITLPLGLYVPIDLHHQHHFDFVGVLATGGAKYRCRACTATQLAGEE